jgi:hypothetical protein
VTDFEPGLQRWEASGLRAPADVRSATLISHDGGLPAFADGIDRSRRRKMQVLCRQLARIVALLGPRGMGVRKATFLLFGRVRPERVGSSTRTTTRPACFGETGPAGPPVSGKKVALQDVLSLPVVALDLFASQLAQAQSSASCLVELDIGGGGGAGAFRLCVPKKSPPRRSNRTTPPSSVFPRTPNSDGGPVGRGMDGFPRSWEAPDESAKGGSSSDRAIALRVHSCCR